MNKEDINFEKEIDSSNIFEWFEDENNLKQEVKNINESESKDILYYIHNIWKFLEISFFCLFFITSIVYWYIYIQKNETIINSNSLDPFCNMILWDIINTDTYCSSIFALNKKYSSEYENLKVKQTEQIIEILWDVYEIENFTKSKDVVFLLNETQNKLRPMKILEEFDNIKRNYDVDKDKIKCYNVMISKGNILSAKCEASSSWFESILWFEGNSKSKVKWTSISVASSFLNFIEKTSKNFTILNKQKVFSSSNEIWDDDGFKKKTVFDIELKYISSNLSL